tara:strand:+ start:788 stop:1912 length:1125 start_codon:yes stop_codon:yes gene_type:complete
MNEIPREAIELTYETGNERKFKRGLGEGRWDRKLKQEMVKLSVADNYEDAKHEWSATGEIWWDFGNGQAPDWVKHFKHCLCGHKIVYHFEICNDQTGIRECVGSDHINSYLILNEIKARTGLLDEQITDEMIQEWIDVKIKSMKSERWWDECGDDFIDKFEDIREIDLRINVNEKGTYWDNNLSMYRPRTTIRKRSSDGNMASIVWRWNHPDNRRNQQEVHGFPNKKLLDDLEEFHGMVKPLSEQMEREDMEHAQRIKLLHKQKNKLVRRTDDDAIQEMAEFYALSNFTKFSSGNLGEWENTFFTSIKLVLSKHKTLTANQLSTVRELLVPATEKQINYLLALGFEGDTTLSKRQASRAINERQKQDGLNSHRA